MARASTMDWEKDLCESFDKLLVEKTRQDQLKRIELIIEDIEDLIFTAFYKGQLYGETNKSIKPATDTSKRGQKRHVQQG